MKPLLYFSSPMLAHIMDASVPAESRESAALSLESYLQSKDGHAARNELREAADALLLEEVKRLDMMVVLWLLDHLDWSQSAQDGESEGFLRNVAESSHAWIVRLRALEKRLRRGEEGQLLDRLVAILRRIEDPREMQDVLDLALLVSNYEILKHFEPLQDKIRRLGEGYEALLPYLNQRAQMVMGRSQTWRDRQSDSSADLLDGDPNDDEEYDIPSGD